MNLLKYSRRRMSYLRLISLTSLNATRQKLVSRFIVNLNRFSNSLTQIMTKRKSNLVRSKQVQKRVIRGKILYRKRNIMGIEKKKPTRTIQVPSRSLCIDCDNELRKHHTHISRRIIIDLVLTKSGIRKTIIEYVGDHSYCSKCNKYYIPPYMIGYSRNQLYGHGFRSWIVYNRIALRMPYSSIREIIDEQFNEKVGETSINIKGEKQYVWTFTDGKHVVFKLRKNREATIAYEFLKSYDGILISDFYPGYDSVQ